ncbi:HCNGP-like protein [Geosmithia morbida]|uniref:HCNGP-like protein n=1 Tax=Geosmithia morbida TaxID=1094350 RepID=A0A9P5D216_9HYPO|nr:HCNGP-like protein [Geosmithia morbida]KAF4123362.1 HCNGP-like protein [Geosmithia morbida]
MPNELQIHAGISKKRNTAEPPKADDVPIIGPVRQSAVLVGPSLPPPSEEEPGIDDDYVAAITAATPGSPYSANRALLHDLTLPSVPNLDMPPSPPGSPPRATSAKFTQFLDLKKKGVHFNAKLESSTALRNPGLTEKLMDFADIGTGDDPVCQYETTLPLDIWNPRALPDSAYRGHLRRGQERAEAEREAQRAAGGRTAVEFVPASSSATPAGGSASAAGGVFRSDKKRGG